MWSDQYVSFRSIVVCDVNEGNEWRVKVERRKVDEKSRVCCLRAAISLCLPIAR